MSNARRTGGRATQHRSAAPSNTIWLIAGALGVIIVLAAAGLAISRRGSAIGQQFANQVPAPANPHIVNATDPHPAYNSNPPTSGWHTGGNIGPWGVTTQPIPDEITIHNLEHGGIIIHYRQNLDPATVTELSNLTRDLQRRSPCVLLIPRPTDKLDTPIAVTAWTWLLKLDSFDANQITQFFEQHLNQGPEQVGCQMRG